MPEPSSASIGGDLHELLTAFEAPAPSPAGGTAGAVVAAMAASLVVMVARASTDWHDGSAVAHEATMLRDRLLTLGEDDVQAFAAVLTASRESDDDARAEALTRAAEVPLEIAERAADVVELAARTAAEGKRPLRADAEAAAILAAAATRAAALLVRVNVSVSRNGDPAANEQLEADAAAAEDRVAAAGR